MMLWARYYGLACLAAHVLTTISYQDNKSTILLAENGRTFSSRIWHL